jgi:hypothetical protein
VDKDFVSGALYSFSRCLFGYCAGILVIDVSRLLCSSVHWMKLMFQICFYFEKEYSHSRGELNE